MSFFGGGRNPRVGTGAGYEPSRGGNYSDNQPPPRAPAGYGGAGGYGYGGGPEKAGSRGGGGGGGGGIGGGGGEKILTCVKATNASMVFQDLVAVSAVDFPPSQHSREVFLKFQNIAGQEFVVTAYPIENQQQHQPGTISFTDPQRGWTETALNDKVRVQRYDPAQAGKFSTIAAMAVYVSFGRNKTDQPYQMEELDAIAKKINVGHIYAPKQPFILQTRGNINLKCTVVTIDLLDLSGGGMGGDNASPTTRGILTKDTEITFLKAPDSDIQIKGGSLKRQPANPIIAPDFRFESLGIGGLDKEFSTIFRRAFVSRIFPPALIEKLGVAHVKGMLLYGPPGTGKTLIAREIGKMLNAREPKVINGPEVLNKYVGQSEENIRKMFGDAEKEYKEKGDDSGLHIIIFDELDAVCKQRGSTSGGTGVGDSVVNQLLSKLDGVNQLNNILLIGMTNRKDMIDDALLRPGRLEVQIEIGLPDKHGRLQILNIHTTKQRDTNMLAPDVDLAELAELAKNFSGAELAGLVRSASSFAMNRHVKVGSMGQINPDVENVQVCRADFLHALGEVKPAFGAAEDELADALPHGIIHYSPTIQAIISRASEYWSSNSGEGQASVNKSVPGSIVNILLYGARGSGTTALAAHLAGLSGYPFVKMVTLGRLSRMRDEYARADYIIKVFADAHKSPLSVVVLDQIARLFDYVALGPRFSSYLLSVLEGQLTTRPPKGHRLLVLATVDDLSCLDAVNLRRAFNTSIRVPSVSSLEELTTILRAAHPFPNSADVDDAVHALHSLGVQDLNLGIKLILDVAFIAQARQGKSVGEAFAERLADELHENMLAPR